MAKSTMYDSHQKERGLPIHDCSRVSARYGVLRLTMALRVSWFYAVVRLTDPRVQHGLDKVCRAAVACRHFHLGVLDV